MNELLDIGFYNHIKEILASARSKVYHAANFAMVRAYLEIGKSIVEKQGGEQRAEYGTQLMKALSKQMTADFGKGFTDVYKRQPGRHVKGKGTGLRRIFQESVMEQEGASAGGSMTTVI